MKDLKQETHDFTVWMKTNRIQLEIYVERIFKFLWVIAREASISLMPALRRSPRLSAPKHADLCAAVNAIAPGNVRKGS